MITKPEKGNTQIQAGREAERGIIAAIPVRTGQPPVLRPSALSRHLKDLREAKLNRKI